MKVVLYSRLSPDDDDGQDIAAQEAQNRQDAEAAGFEVVGAFRDAKVSGAVPPMERPGFRATVEHAQAVGAEIATRDWPRFSRQNPADAAAALLDCPVHVHVLRDNKIPAQTREAQQEDPMSAGMSFFSFFGGWQYRAAAVKNARNTAAAFASGAKQTKSGKAPHRPIKIEDAEARAAWDEMHAEKPPVSLRVMAHTMSERRGAFAPSIEAAERRRRHVTHKALARAFERLGLGQNPNRDERVSPQGMAGPGSKGALTPTAEGA